MAHHGFAPDTQATRQLGDKRGHDPATCQGQPAAQAQPLTWADRWGDLREGS